MLDGTNVIDYVQFAGPNSLRDLNAELTSPDQLDPNGLWQTNLLGVFNQLNLSKGSLSPNQVPPEDGGQWVPPPVPGIISIPQMQAYFQGLFMPNNIGTSYNWGSTPGATETNHSFGTQAPYTPTRTVVQYISWQANDPLVHYVASDLNYSGNEEGILFTGITNSDRMEIPILPDLGNVNDRYQPWGMNSQMAELPNVDSNAFNLAFKDPLVWKPDDWNFPNGNGLPLATLGQVHRGTPWQTVYLKASNLLKEFIKNGVNTNYIGTNTWAQWTGDTQLTYGQYIDAALSAPANDWRLVGVLVALLSTNDPTQLMSVNDRNTADWLNVLGSITVQTNSTRFPYWFIVPQFESYVLSSNSPQALIIANAIAQSKTIQPNQTFNSPGDILATPQLTVNSPWLNTSTVGQVEYGISDEAYEAIPAQLLLLLRPDSVGVMIQVNSGWNIQFSGSDGYAYALQTSTNLVNWDVVSTNYPVQGSFSVPIPSVPNSPERFYRSMLLP